LNGRNFRVLILKKKSGGEASPRWRGCCKCELRALQGKRKRVERSSIEIGAMDRGKVKRREKKFWGNHLPLESVNVGKRVIKG